MHDLVVRLGALARGVNRPNGRRGGAVVRVNDVTHGRRSTVRARDGNGCGVSLAREVDSESNGDDVRDGRVGTVDLDRNAQTLTEQAAKNNQNLAYGEINQPYSAQAFLVVRPTAANIDLDVVGDQPGLGLLEGTDDT